MIIDMGYFTRVIKNILIVAVTAIGVYFAFKLSIFYLPFLIAFIISILIEPIIKFVARKTNFTRKSSAIIVLVIVSIIIVGLITWGIIAILDEASNLLQGLNGYYENIYNKIQEIVNSNNFDKIQLPKEVSDIINNSSVQLLEYISTWVKNSLTSLIDTATSLPIIFIYIGVTLLSIYFICTDRFYILDQLEHHFPRLWMKRFTKHLKELISTLGNYLKAEMILVLISFVQVLIGLHIMKFAGLNVEYPLLAAIAIGFVDALPILGSGTVIIPWAVFSACNGDITLALWLLILFIIISVVRQFIEPKIVSKQIGIHPIFTLIAMYTGLKFMGILGLLIGPIVLIILKNVFGTLIDKGFVKTIFDKK